MAKLNTSRADLIAQLFKPDTGSVRAVRSDGTVLARNWVSGQWQVRGKIIEGMSVEAWIERRRANGWRDLKRGDVPSYNRVRAMALGDEPAEATDGCEGLEPDGQCQHGCHAWPRALGLL
jgi:hypothetical protein